MFRQYPFLGNDSTAAAEASECASEQNLFWPYHDLLYSKQVGENTGAFAKDKLKSYAKDVKGLDTTQFNACVDAGKYAQKVADEKADGIKQGVTATPTILVGDEVIRGLPKRDEFYAKIDARLK